VRDAARDSGECCACGARDRAEAVGVASVGFGGVVMGNRGWSAVGSGAAVWDGTEGVARRPEAGSRY
jgi:hypothetical protein